MANQNLIQRFQDAKRNFKQFESDATDDQLARYRSLKQSFRDMLVTNGREIIDLRNQPMPITQEGIALTVETTDNCLNSLDGIVSEMEELAEDVF